MRPKIANAPCKGNIRLLPMIGAKLWKSIEAMPAAVGSESGGRAA